MTIWVMVRITGAIIWIIGVMLTTDQQIENRARVTLGQNTPFGHAAGWKDINIRRFLNALRSFCEVPFHFGGVHMMLGMKKGHAPPRWVWRRGNGHFDVMVVRRPKTFCVLTIAYQRVLLHIYGLCLGGVATDKL